MSVAFASYGAFQIDGEAFGAMQGSASSSTTVAASPVVLDALTTSPTVVGVAGFNFQAGVVGLDALPLGPSSVGGFFSFSASPIVVETVTPSPMATVSTVFQYKIDHDVAPRTKRPVSRRSLGSDLREVLKGLAKPTVGEDLREVLELMANQRFAWLGMRKANRSTPCDCTKATGNVNKSCKRCLGTGFGFTDRLISGYFWMSTEGKSFITEAGRIATQTRNLVLQHDRPINKFDQILLLDVDPDTGEPVQPFKIMKRFLIQDSIGMRGPGGRLEFWKCEAEERTFSDDQGGEAGTGYQHLKNR